MACVCCSTHFPLQGNRGTSPHRHPVICAAECWREGVWWWSVQEEGRTVAVAGWMVGSGANGW